MRVGLKILLLLLGAPCVTHLAAPARGADAGALFETGNKLYEERKFTEAAAAYQAAAGSGQNSPALYFNLGNALFKSGNTGRSILAYRHAARLTPRDPDVRANLQFARNQVEGPTLHAPRWQRALETLSLNEWTALSVAGLWLTFILLAAGQWRPALKPALRSALAATGIATLVIAVCMISSLIANASGKLLVVTAKEAIVRKGPFVESESAFAAHDGAELLVLDHKDAWLQVSDGTRRVGWLKSEEVAPINL